MPSTIHIAMCTDAGYSIPTLVALTSAKINKSGESRYCVHLMLTESSPSLEAMLQELRSDDFEVEVREVDISHMKDTQSCCYVTPTALLRLELAALLPELDRVLYLDCDALVVKDLSELYHVPLGDNLLAAVPERYLGRLPAHSHEVVGDAPYCNSGILVMNLELFRKEHLADSLMAKMKEVNGRWRLLDQDVLNHVCLGRIYHLPVRYNWMISLYRDGKGVELINERCGTQYRNRFEMEADVVIYHLAGKEKVWDFVNVAGCDLWMHYYHLSPCRNQALMRRVHMPQIQSLRSALSQRMDSIDNVLAARVTELQKELLHMQEDAARCLNEVNQKLQPRTRVRLKLFGFLPLLSIRTRCQPQGSLPARVSVILFGFIPLWSVCRKGNSAWVKLLDFLPIIRMKG